MKTFKIFESIVDYEDGSIVKESFLVAKVCNCVQKHFRYQSQLYEVIDIINLPDYVKVIVTKL